MILLHTADWHLGQCFFEYDRSDEHLEFLQWLKAQVCEGGVDALLVAGDVFDGPNPSAGSQRMFYRFLREVSSARPGLQTVIIAGNHDSGARLEAPDPLLEEMNVTVRGVIKRTPEGEIDYRRLIVPLMADDGGVAAWCLAVPYLRQGDYPESDSYQTGVARMYERLYGMVEDRSKPIVAMGHLQASGAEVSENDRSERTIIGGLECISPDCFDGGIAYTALGHLHRAQRVSGRGNVCYAGSPLPMSFAERNNRQSVSLVEITDSGEARVERIRFQPPRALLSIPGSPEPPVRVLEEIGLLPDGEVTLSSPYLEVKALITEPEPSLRYRIEEALKNKPVRLARIVAFTPGSDRDIPALSCEELQSVSPMAVAVDIFRRRYRGEEMPGRMKELLQNVIREAAQ
ncbi:MAG: exonuclease SbcCD subunit D C-terminal domain-containing protein [Tannerellaceae bacterium]|jgi:exonuclease SbcD|nr:exonuclease SbcCD subunit D C-terminal domain-containing protein [Tannerellaceae bacterium]